MDFPRKGQNPAKHLAPKSTRLLGLLIPAAAVCTLFVRLRAPTYLDPVLLCDEGQTKIIRVRAEAERRTVVRPLR